MRGIGMTSIDIGGEGAVAFLQDGAIVPRPAAQLMGMFDLDQVEVLRVRRGRFTVVVLQRAQLIW